VRFLRFRPHKLGNGSLYRVRPRLILGEKSLEFPSSFFLCARFVIRLVLGVKKMPFLRCLCPCFAILSLAHAFVHATTPLLLLAIRLSCSSWSIWWKPAKQTPPKNFSLIMLSYIAMGMCLVVLLQKLRRSVVVGCGRCGKWGIFSLDARLVTPRFYFLLCSFRNGSGTRRFYPVF
jgi:hypothetical protein